MTREEKEKAINALKVSVPMCATTQEEFINYRQTLNKAVDWLEQEPTTKNDLGVDCISREEAIKTIQRYGVGCFDADEFSPEECERFVIGKLNELDSVTPQVPIIDKIRAEIEKWHKEGTNWSHIRLMEIENIVNEVQGRK